MMVVNSIESNVAVMSCVLWTVKKPMFVVNPG